MPPMPTSDAALETHLDQTKDARLESYKDFLRIPSISALPEHLDDCRTAAHWLRDALTAAGLEHAEAVETGGPPIVYADWLHAPDAPTVLIYGHYDVQPVDPLDLWTSPPFEPAVVGDRILARGAADDKGQVHAHVMAAKAVMAAYGKFPINVKYVFEGEEESSSVHLDHWLETERGKLAADVAIISDTGFFEGNLPAITLSLRGLMYAQIDVVGTAIDLHSGIYGGAVQNPANALAVIIAGLKGPDGLDSGSRASTMTSSRCPRRTGRPSQRSPSMRRPIRLISGCRSSSARPGSRPSSAGRYAPPSTSTGSGAASRGREQDDHPRPRPRQGQLPVGDRAGSRQDLRGLPRVRRADRPARGDPHGPEPRWRAAEPDTDG